MATPQTTNNLKGIVALCVGIALFAAQDTIVKALSGDYAVTLAIVLRAFVSFPVLIALIVYHGGLRQLETPHWRILCVRGGILMTAYITYFIAFPALPLAEAIALFFMVPVFITLMAGPMLGEKITLMAWAAVAIGLVGVGLIFQPGSAIFNPAALLSLVAAAAYSLAMILARKHGSDVPASVMAFYQNAVYLVGALAVATIFAVFDVQPQGHPSLDFLVRAWSVPSFRDMGLMGLCGIIAAFGMTLLTQAYRVGQANVVTPFEYTGMIWGVFWGMVLFNETPRLTTILGMALIAVAGILALRGQGNAKAPSERVK
jgi:drug/metabolite transporter (DMT)-like permease